MIEEYSATNMPNIKELVAPNYDNIPKSDRPVIRGIGVLTSGGDAPGMNATIRAVVRAGLHTGHKVFGVMRGYHGLWKGEIEELNGRDVSEKLQRGGTFLMTARSKTFETPEGVVKGATSSLMFGIFVALYSSIITTTLLLHNLSILSHRLKVNNIIQALGKNRKSHQKIAILSLPHIVEISLRISFDGSTQYSAGSLIFIFEPDKKTTTCIGP